MRIGTKHRLRLLAHAGLFTVLLAVLFIPMTVLAEQRPSIAPAATVPAVWAWFDRFNVGPSGNAALFNGYSTAVEVCQVTWPGYPVRFEPYYSYPGHPYNGITGNCYVLLGSAWAPSGQPSHYQNCPAGYYVPNGTITFLPKLGSSAYFDANQLTCQNLDAPNRCPEVAMGETPYVLDPGGLTCSRPDQCLPPNTINPNTGRCEQPSYTIKLDQQGTSPIAPSTLLPFSATVTDQVGIAQANRQVSISVDVKDGTGGHIHTANRPKGILSCASGFGGEPAKCTLSTDSMGRVFFDFISTPISGTHVVTVTCSGCSNTETKSVDVMVKDLIPIPASTEYALVDSSGKVIGAIPGKHTENHYLTNTSITKLNQLVNVYEDINPGARLYLNDASLVWGGLFDVGSRPWGAPHSTHHKGRSLDIRATNSGPNNEGAVPEADFEDFVNKANEKGLGLGLHCKNSSNTNYCLGQPNNRHFHVDF